MTYWIVTAFDSDGLAFEVGCYATHALAMEAMDLCGRIAKLTAAMGWSTYSGGKCSDIEENVVEWDAQGVVLTIVLDNTSHLEGVLSEMHEVTEMAGAAGNLVQSFRVEEKPD